jgi:pyruvate dehydrogenase (quinone)
MACGLPYAMAAQIAYPGRQCVAFVGDGGLSMLMAELATCVKYQLPVKIIVVKNDTLGQIKWEQIAFLGNPEYGVDLQSIDFVKVAEACGMQGIRIEEQENCGALLDDALSRSGPVLVEAVVDGLEPPMPAKVTREQTENFLKALAKGQPDAQEIGRNVLGQKIRELI